MNLKTLNDKIKYLESLKKPSNNKKEQKERILDALFHFKIDFSKTKKIHITGTNGKGSTSLYLLKLLSDNNYRVGLFSSPYVYSFNERIKINNENISNKILDNAIDMFLEYVKESNIKFSFFESIFIISLIIFNKENLDYLIIEAGIGGLFDCTNIIYYDNAIITNVSCDHMDILGSKIDDIFYQKIGIYKPQTILHTTVSRRFLPKIRNISKKYNTSFYYINPSRAKIINKSPYYFIYNNEVYKTSSYAKYEIENVILAVEVFKYLTKINDIEIINKSIMTTNLPGRFEIRNNIILDGAHNEKAFIALFNSIKNYTNINNTILIFSQLEGKDIKKNIKIINKYYKNYYYFIFPDKRIIKKLPKIFKGHIINNENKLEDLIQNNKDKIIIITGSIHLLGYLGSKIK